MNSGNFIKKIFNRLGAPAGASMSADIAATAASAADAAAHANPDPAGTAAGLHAITDGLVTGVSTEVETTSIAAGAGSVATTTRLGLIIRWVGDAVNNAAFGLSALATKIGDATATRFGSIFGLIGVSSNPATLWCPNAGSADFAAWAALTNTGKFTVVIDGVTLTDVNPDFTGDLSMADVAASIQAALDALLPGTTCAWSATFFYFSSPTIGGYSSIGPLLAPTAGVDIAAAAWINGKTGYCSVTDILRAARRETETISLDVAGGSVANKSRAGLLFRWLVDNVAKETSLQTAADAAITANASVVAIKGKTDYLQDLENAVYFDSALGGAGTAWPIGTAQSPSNTIADVITMCTARKTKKIVVAGALTLGATMAGYTFIGVNKGAVITLGGQDVSGSHFYNCTVTGTQGGAGQMHLHDCRIDTVVGFAANAYDCVLATAGFIPRSSSTSRLFGLIGESMAVIDFNGITAAVIFAFKVAGSIASNNSTDAGNVVVVMGVDGCGFTSAAANTFGTMMAYGDCNFVKGAGGATETDATIYSKIAALPTDVTIQADADAAITANLLMIAAAADAAAAAAGVGAAPADMALNSEVETTTIAALGGSVATLTRLGSLIRWIGDHLNVNWTPTRAGYVDKCNNIPAEVASHYICPLINDNTVQTFNTVAADKDFIAAVAATGLPTTTNANLKQARLVLCFSVENTYAGANYLDCSTATDNQLQLNIDGGGYADLQNGALADGQFLDGAYNIGATNGIRSIVRVFDITAVLATNIDGTLGVRWQKARAKQASLTVTLDTAFLIIDTKNV